MLTYKIIMRVVKCRPYNKHGGIRNACKILIWKPEKGADGRGT
jgi:putative component of membrane protein insertase Oxa1/YidC/SpoIIIJ protein YidD